MLEDPNHRLLMNYAMRALARRAHSSSEMREKLKKRREHTPAHEEKVIQRLQELQLLNDDAYTQAVIQDTVRLRPQGTRKVAQKLLRKGIPYKKTQEIWVELELSERELALEALQRAARRFKGLSKQEAYEKRARFLAARGFSPDLIFELAKTAETI